MTFCSRIAGINACSTRPERGTRQPENLRHAHDRNDEVLERIYIGRRFRNDTERLEKLFELYTKRTAEQPQPKKKGKSAA